MSFYPVFLQLQGRRGVVVGGGAVAEQKVVGLLEAGARVTVVSPDLTSTPWTTCRTAPSSRRPYIGRELASNMQH